LNDRWYIYYAAAHPQRGNKSHRMYVLAGPVASENPCQGQWEFLGRIENTPEQWAIDGTVFTLEKKLYFVYSGWPLDNTDGSDLVQELFIQRLEDPTTAATAPVVISRPEYPWEFSCDCNGYHGINEGPQFLSAPGSTTTKWQGLVYSCAGSWTNEYKMAVLQFTGGDPVDPAAWRKRAEPLISTQPNGTGPWGPGHGSFVNLDGQVVSIYHATDSPTDGWENRRARVQRVSFTDKGPFMASPVGAPARKGDVLSHLKYKLQANLDNAAAREKDLRALLNGQRMANRDENH
jgi:GH43 family beta-xylosidase